MKYVVETVSMFRMRYVVDTDSAAKAEDRVVLNDSTLKELAQKHLDEVIVTTRAITDDEFLEMFDEDNPYLAQWPNEDKFKLVN